nr:N-acetyltransferase family protein [uncultured Methanoregula sp.]
MQDYTLGPLMPSDRKAIVDIFNYYIKNSFAAYPENPVPYEFFDHLLETCRNYPSVVVRGPGGEPVGFGLLRPHNPMPAFHRTAEITYFIRPESTGNGLGSLMLGHLQACAKERGITTLLASISSLNEGSIRFHGHHGFVECGRFSQVAEKKGIVFDTVWMQKFL